MEDKAEHILSCLQWFFVNKTAWKLENEEFRFQLVALWEKLKNLHFPNAYEVEPFYQNY